jgi:hypothetical protein
MTQITSRINAHGQAVVDGWRTFWFSREPAYTLGLVRIAFGALVLYWALEFGRDLYDLFGVNGMVPPSPSPPPLWSVFDIYPGDGALLVGWIVLIVAAIALTVGWHSRIAAILVFILVLSFQRRDPWIFNSGESLMRIEALFLALAPCGGALSLDQSRRTGSFWSAQEREIWPIRLMQIQVSIIYLCTVVAKLRGDTWQNGTAVSYSLRIQDLQLLSPPSWLTDNVFIVNAMTWGTLLIEVAIGILVWNRRCRLWVLLAGVALHLGIMLFIVIGPFSLAMFVLYLAFIPADRAKAIAVGAEKRWTALVARLRRRDVAPDDGSGPEDGIPNGRDEQIGENDEVAEDERNDRHLAVPVVTASRSDKDLAPPKRDGHIRVLDDAPRRRPTDVSTNGHRWRLADAPPNGHPRRVVRPVPVPVPVPERGSDEPSSGRHARGRATTDVDRSFHWPEDVRARITD